MSFIFIVLLLADHSFKRGTKDIGQRTRKRY